MPQKVSTCQGLHQAAVGSGVSSCAMTVIRVGYSCGLHMHFSSLMMESFQMYYIPSLHLTLNPLSDYISVRRCAGERMRCNYIFVGLPENRKTRRATRVFLPGKRGSAMSGNDNCVLSSALPGKTITAKTYTC
jgi:hypothetical protein